jgi:hypothetical protein
LPILEAGEVAVDELEVVRERPPVAARVGAGQEVLLDREVLE